MKNQIETPDTSGDTSRSPLPAQEDERLGRILEYCTKANRYPSGDRVLDVTESALFFANRAIRDLLWLVPAYRDLRNNYDTLKAENERLRAALAQVREAFFVDSQAGFDTASQTLVDDKQHPWIAGAHAPRVISIIDAALTGREGGNDA